jgi:hypothetical protein
LSAQAQLDLGFFVCLINIIMEESQEQAASADNTDAELDYELIPLPEEPAPDPSKTGPKGRRLVAVEVQGYEVGRGLRRRVVVPRDVYELAAIGCTDREIAQWFDVNEDTLRYNFADIMQKGREDLKHSLRRAQIKLALSGNAVMLIWLGKQILSQQETPTNGEDQKALPWQE